MFNKESLEYLVGLKPVEIKEIDKQIYSTEKLYHVVEPSPENLTATTLTSLIDYIKSGMDHKASPKLIIQVKSPSEVKLYSEIRNDKSRECYMSCNAMLPNNIKFNNFLDTENFNIMLQSSFVDNEDRKVLLQITGNITDEAVKNVSDDGISQSVTIKTGVAKKDNVLVPNPAILAPYRTFPEVIQPESKFIFRMKEGPYAALYEADGGAWRNQAMQSIKEYLENNLKEVSNIEIIS